MNKVKREMKGRQKMKAQKMFRKQVIDYKEREKK